MKLKLDNLVYDTNNPNKIKRLIELGAEEIKEEKKEEKKTEKKSASKK